MTRLERLKHNRKRLLWSVITIAVLIIAAAALRYAYNERYDLYRKKDFVCSQTTGYSEGIPLEGMDFKRYLAFMPADDLSYCPDLVIRLPLPCDINYYTHREDAEPALILKAGTEVLAVPSTAGVEEGYGFVSWPSYEEEWRYAQPFVMEDGTEDSLDVPMYFVRLSELERVSQAFLQANRKSVGSGRLPQLVWMQTRAIDTSLYRQGVFCSEDLERMFLW